MADRDESDSGLGTRLALGALAGLVATMALTSTMKRLHAQYPDRDPEEGAAAPVSGAAPELRLAASFAFGAACGAALAAVNPRPGRLKGAAAGGGLWLAARMGWLPAFAALPETEGGVKGDLTSLGGHFAWGWSMAEALRELGGVRNLLAQDRTRA